MCETEHKLVVKQLAGEKSIGLKHVYYSIFWFVFLIAVISKNMLWSECVPFIMALLFLKPSSSSLGSIYLMFTFNITKDMSSNVLGILQINNSPCLRLSGDLLNLTVICSYALFITNDISYIWHLHLYSLPLDQERSELRLQLLLSSEK